MYDPFTDSSIGDTLIDDDEGLSYLAIIIEELRNQFNNSTAKECFEAFVYKSYPEIEDLPSGFSNSDRVVKSITISWRPGHDLNTQHKHIELISLCWNTIEKTVDLAVRTEDSSFNPATGLNNTTKSISNRSANTYFKYGSKDLICKEVFNVSKRIDIRKSMLSLYKLISTWDLQNAPQRRINDLAHVVLSAFPNALDDILIGEIDGGKEVLK